MESKAQKCGAGGATDSGRLASSGLHLIERGVSPALPDQVFVAAGLDDAAILQY
ncbi:MAG: hypothetical protein M3442_02100 [Chloroflexota bacterium]|nr:hypothetical protein [Chloroflexota bacterium]